MLTIASVHQLSPSWEAALRRDSPKSPSREPPEEDILNLDWSPQSHRTLEEDTGPVEPRESSPLGPSRQVSVIGHGATRPTPRVTQIPPRSDSPATAPARVGRPPSRYRTPEPRHSPRRENSSTRSRRLGPSEAVRGVTRYRPNPQPGQDIEGCFRCQRLDHSVKHCPIVRHRRRFWGPPRGR